MEISTWHKTWRREILLKFHGELNKPKTQEQRANSRDATNRLTVMILNTLRQYHYFNEVWIVVNTSSFTCTHSNMKYWIQYVRQGVQGSSTSVEYSFSAENHQFDTLSVHNSNYLNLVTFEMCSFCLWCVLTHAWLDRSFSFSHRR